MSLITYGMGGSLSAGDEATLTVNYELVNLSSIELETKFSVLESVAICNADNELISITSEEDSITSRRDCE